VEYGLFLPNFGPFGDATVLADLAVEAERCGWDGLFMWDHLLFEQNPPQDVVDPWVALTAIAVRTTRLKMGALITPLARRRPWKVARETVSIDRLSNGRLIFGAGLGFPAYEEFELFGEEPEDRIRACKLDEGLAILDGLWSAKPFSFEGVHYRVAETMFLPSPLQQPRPPVWVAAWWPNKPPLRRAARWDGVFAELDQGGLLTPGQLRELLDYVHEHRESSAPFDAALDGFTPNDPAAGAELVEQYMDSGLTWWLERIAPDRYFTIEETRDRIQAGPPRR
jgi:alkanesulfonate monooxygenase SsuD/methylene tetrahydromethanopterin reductase-like flavin-dependent oxidoreductase (luciferase family)